jgi:hypothetical protein
MRTAPFLALCLSLAVAGIPTAGALDLRERGPGPAYDRAQDDRRPPWASPFVPRPPADADPRGERRGRDAVRRGEIRPLEQVIAQVQRRYPGRVLDAQLDRSGERWVYHLKMLTREGRVLRVAVDAHSGRILDVRGRGRR